MGVSEGALPSGVKPVRILYDICICIYIYRERERDRDRERERTLSLDGRPEAAMTGAKSCSMLYYTVLHCYTHTNNNNNM